ncbi:MAG: response regulator [Desulfobacteraceae bacterium]|nr:response regulator [Desulfobacteraceae bacterium]
METKTIEKTHFLVEKGLIRALLVEDDEIDIRLTKRILANCSRPIKFVIEPVRTLSEAVEYLGSREYDVVLLDLGLPDSSGIETVQKVSEANPHVSIVVLTGLDDEETGLSAIRNGATDYLAKGLLLENLLVRTVLYALERKQAEEKKIQAAQQWRTTFDSITEMISIHDKNHKIVRVNTALARFFKKGPKELIGKSCYELFHGLKEPCSNCPHTQTLETKKPATLEFFEPHLGIHVGISTSPIFDEEGEVTGSVHLTKNITERKLAEEKLRKANEKLEEYNQLKDEFVSTASHELRTPLSIIMGAIKLVLDEIPGKIVQEQRYVLAEAMENVQRLTNTVDSLLNISRIESGKMDWQAVSVNICKLIGDTVSNCKALAREEGITLDYEVPRRSIDIRVDPDKTKQVLINLISNSLKFTPKGGWVKVICSEHDREILVSVEDCGVGIAQEDLPKLFDKFTQFGRRAGPGEKGTGLGLAISKQIVELAKGRIWAESEPGKGSKFTFTLPKK